MDFWHFSFLLSSFFTSLLLSKVEPITSEPLFHNLCKHNLAYRTSLLCERVQILFSPKRTRKLAVSPFRSFHSLGSRASKAVRLSVVDQKVSRAGYVYIRFSLFLLFGLVSQQAGSLLVSRQSAGSKGSEGYPKILQELFILKLRRMP